MFAEAAAEDPDVPYVYAQIGKPQTDYLRRIFAFKPYEKHEVHRIVGGKAVRSFRFATAQELKT